jgi:isocitrate dehydrogenase kinase/phosphatase
LAGPHALPTSRLAKDTARAIRDAFVGYRDEFRTLTRQAGERFHRRDWRAMAADAKQRLSVRAQSIDRLMDGVRTLLGPRIDDRLVWIGAKAVYSGLIDERDDWELAETYFNSATRKVFTTEGVDAEVEFVHPDHASPPRSAAQPCYRRYEARSWPDLIEGVLYDHPELGLSEASLRAGAGAATAKALEAVTAGGASLAPVVEVAVAPFYRGERAYLAGRIPAPNDAFLPLVLCFHHEGDQLEIDAVLTDESDVRLLFSYTRSYFQVDAERPYDLVHFLKTLMPRKSRAEIYISLGYHKHGKTELYRHALRHLATSTDSYQRAEGARGMVMTVFTMPSYPVVFKIIKDRCDEPKQCTRREVIEQYQLVFEHDRAGRLIDAQEYEYLALDRRRFDPQLVAELLDAAADSVKVDGDRLVIKHCYAERRVTPLDVYLRHADPLSAGAAVIDYGQAIKDLAITNLFPGDLLLKNFGVTRQRRVVFYDYDEVRLLTECRFLKIPEPLDEGVGLPEEPWFGVSPGDVFPEEFERFLGLSPELKALFLQHHGDLLSPEFWQDIQRRLRAGELFHVPPYGEEKRLNRRVAPAA